MNDDNNLDELFDNLDFKPITDGLGFHHSLKEKKEVTSNLKSQSDSLKKDFEARAKQVKRSAKTPIKSSRPTTSTAVNMGELAPFYNNEVAPVETSELKIKLEDKVEEKKIIVNEAEAGMSLRASAWVLDLVLLATIMLLTFTAIIIFSELPMETLNLFMVSDELLVSFLAMAGLFYVFYFSFFDKTKFSTPGKRILNLRVESTRKKQKDVSIVQSFMRAVYSIVSVVALGLPALLKLQDKLTDTKVVKA